MRIKANSITKIMILCVLTAVLFHTPIYAEGVNGGGTIANSVNHEYYDIRHDIGTATGPFWYTVPTGEDTVAVPVSMYATNTQDTSGLSISEFYNVIYYDTIELKFLDVEGIYWYTDSIEVDVEHFSGDTARIEIHGYSDPVGFDPETWEDIYNLRFFIRCDSTDEIQLGMAVNEVYSENWVKISGSSLLEEYDSFDPGYAEVMAYWAYMTVDSVETLLGDDTVRVPVYLDSNNYMFWAFKNVFYYDTANYTFVRAERGEFTSDWTQMISGGTDNMASVIAYIMGSNEEPITEPVELCKLVFYNKATTDSITSPITFYDHIDSNFVSPPLQCYEFGASIDYTFNPGQIVVPVYEMSAQLNFPDGAQPGDTATLEVNVMQNYPAGKVDIGDIQFLIKHDYRFDYYDYGNVHDSIYISVTEINDTLIGINLNYPNGRPGYLPPSDSLVKYCDLYLIVADSCDYDCPDSMYAEFMASYGQHYATRAVDTTGNVECTTANGKLTTTNDILQVMCGMFHASSPSGSDRATQHFYVDHNFELDSFTIKIAYNSGDYCILASSMESGVICDEDYDDDTVMLIGSDLEWAADEDDHIGYITWGARKTGQKSMTTDLNSSLAYLSSGTLVNTEESDATVSTNMGIQISPCPLIHIPRDESSLPREFSLHQNCPNPFNPITVISFELPHSCNVNLAVYNILGQKVTSLVDDNLDAGHYSIPWNSENSHVSSGVYFYILRAGDFTDTKKMLLVK